jgi:phosphatidylinositol phospholipase C, gamma-1
MFGEKNMIGQTTLPINCIRSGYRSVPLRNKYSEELELASLLVHVAVKKI